MRSGPELRTGPDLRASGDAGAEQALLGEVGQRVLRLLSNAAVQGIHLSRATTGRIEASPVTSPVPSLAPSAATPGRTPADAGPQRPSTAARAATTGMPVLQQLRDRGPGAPAGWSESSEGEGLSQPSTSQRPVFDRSTGSVEPASTPAAQEVFTRAPAAHHGAPQSRRDTRSGTAGRPTRTLQAPGTGRPVSPPGSLRPRDLLAVPAREAVTRSAASPAGRISEPAETAAAGWEAPQEQLVTLARAIGRVVEKQQAAERRTSAKPKRRAPSRPATGAPSYAARSPGRGAPLADDEEAEAEVTHASAAPTGPGMTWRAPQRRQKVQRPTPAPPAPRPDTKVLEEMAEEELLQVLRSLTVASPEARQLLREVQQQIDEYWRIERLRQIS
jgi:hypothetical protein